MSADSSTAATPSERRSAAAHSRCSAAAAALQLRNENRPQLDQVAAPQERAGIGQQLRELLQAAKERCFLKGEIHLGSIEHVEDDDLVPLVAQVLETGQQVGRLVEQVAEDDDDAAALDHASATSWKIGAQPASSVASTALD